MKSFIGTIIIIFINSFQPVNAQEVNVTLSYDTVYVGNVVAVRYAMENWQGEVKQPGFGQFEVVGGPQITSSMSYSGGQRRSSRAITFFLKPPEQPGGYYLPALTFVGEGKEVTTDEKRIIVKDNPDDIQQDPAIENKGYPTFDKQYKRKEPERGQRQRF